MKFKCLTYRRKSLLLLASLLIWNQLFAQTFFQEKAQAVGIDHYFFNGNLMGGGVAVFDFNQDGWEDIWINGGSHRDVLYQNKGDGTFKEIGDAAGLMVTADFLTTGVVTGDIDNDGFRDVFVTTRDDTPNLLFHNNGNGTFTNISESSGINELIAWSTNAAFADVNLDGFQDIYIGNYVEKFGYIADREQGILAGYDHECQPNFLLINNGDRTFSERADFFQVADKGCALASTFTDFDSDGDVDLMVVNDYGEWVLPNDLLVNQKMENGASSFEGVPLDSEARVGIYAMGVAVGDYDQDNDLDYYLTNLGRNVLLQNQGGGVFVDSTEFAAVEDTYAGKDLTVGWGTSFLDVDNDSDLDLFVANGFISALSFNRTSLENEDKLFINQGNKEETGGVTFSDESKVCGLGDPSTARGFAKGDFDNDGDLDIVVVRVSGSTDLQYRKKVLYYENLLDNSNNWLKVKVNRVNTQEVYGTQIQIYVNGRSWISEVNGGSSHASQHSSIFHFGLNEATIVDSLKVSFPGGGTQVYTDIAINQLLVVEEEVEFSTNLVNLEENTAPSIAPNPANLFTKVVFQNPNKKLFNIYLHNTLGNTIQQIQTTDNQLVIKRNSLPAGMYFIGLTNADGKLKLLKIVFR